MLWDSQHKILWNDATIIGREKKCFFECRFKEAAFITTSNKCISQISSEVPNIWIRPSVSVLSDIRSVKRGGRDYATSTPPTCFVLYKELTCCDSCRTAQSCTVVVHCVCLVHI